MNVGFGGTLLSFPQSSYSRYDHTAIIPLPAHPRAAPVHPPYPGPWEFIRELRESDEWKQPPFGGWGRSFSRLSPPVEDIKDESQRSSRRCLFLGCGAMSGGCG
jgi:hypothetical protein